VLPILALSEHVLPLDSRRQRVVRDAAARLRSLKHLVNALAEFEALGIAFVSLRDNLDLSTPSGRLMFQIIGAMAEFERSLIVERVKAGLRNAKSKGRQLGRPRLTAAGRRSPTG
jgi:DNA invertase Pin-like site-specific DNA recombinase